MCSNRECAAYFKQQKAYDRCFLELKKKWKSYGRAAGRITLSQTSEEERRAIGGILGKVFYEETIRFSFSDFERGLQSTRFAPVSIKDVLEAYFGESLLTNQGRQQAEQEQKQQFFKGLCSCLAESDGTETWGFFWLRHMISEKKYGYQLLMREYGKDEKQAETLALHVGRALSETGKRVKEEEECPLAVLAAEISGNPHYFDRNTAAGQLLVHGICCCGQMEMPEHAHQWRELLMRVFIIPDNVSSMVHACGLRLRTKDGWHPAYDAFWERRESYVLTMENLRGIIGAQAMGARVYVVENEMVFSYLLDRQKPFDGTLLCTSGQPRSAALVLIARILAGGAEIFYNGDLDPDGIRIADRLWQKFGDSFHIWRMSPADYERSLSKETIGELGAAKLETVCHPVLKQTAACMRARGLAGYQENMLRELLGDMTAGENTR